MMEERKKDHLMSIYSMKSHLGLFVMIKKETNLHQAVFIYVLR